MRPANQELLGVSATRTARSERLWLLFLLSLLCLLVGTLTPSTTGAFQEEAAAETGLLEGLEKAAIAGGLPAIGAIVLDSEGVVAAAVHGVRKVGSEVPVTRDDLWHIGSITKSFTSALVATRVARGELDWDTTVAELTGELATDSPFASVTIRQLLGHRAGLMANLRPQEANQLRTSGDSVIEQRAAALSLLLQSEPVGPAGETFLYSNAGYILVGALLERRFGVSWEDQLRSRVLAPLGLFSAGFGPPGTIGEIDQPRGHSSAGERLQPMEPGPWADNPPFLGPAGTLHLSLTDLGAWAQEHLRAERSRGRLLESASAQTLHAPLGDGDYALGWATAPKPGGGVRYWHNGSNTLWMALVAFDVEADRAVAIVTNGGIAAGPLVDRMAAELLDGGAGAGSQGD